MKTCEICGRYEAPAGWDGSGYCVRRSSAAEWPTWNPSRSIVDCYAIGLAAEKARADKAEAGLSRLETWRPVGEVPPFARDKEAVTGNGLRHVAWRAPEDDGAPSDGWVRDDTDGRGVGAVEDVRFWRELPPGPGQGEVPNG